MGHEKTARLRPAQLALAIATTALFLLALASPAQAADEHLFDPVLSLEGDCKAEDGVADPGCTGAPLAYPAGNAPKAFNIPCGTATDPHGSIYVANSGGTNINGVFKTGEVAVFDPQGKFLTKIPTEKGSCKLAVDSQGVVYVLKVESQTSEGKTVASIDRFEPDSYPPTAATTYSFGASFNFILHEEGEPVDLCATPRSIAVDPSNDHLYISHQCYIEEYGSAAEGTPLNPLLDCCIGETDFGVSNGGVDVYGGNHDVYVTTRDSTSAAPATLSAVSIFDGSDGELKCTLDGSDTPNGSFSLEATASLAVDQSNGDFYVYDKSRNSVMQFGGGGEGCPHFIGELPPSSQPLVFPGTPGLDLAVDAPCRKGPGLAESCDIGTYESPNAGHLFATSGTSANNSHLFAFAAVGTEEYLLTVSKAGTGTGKVTSSPGIDCGSDCSEEYEEGTKVTLTATPEGGSTFAGWSGSGCSGTGTCEVTMSAAKEVTAEFTAAAKPKFALKVKKAGSGTGTVTSSPAGINCGLDCEEEYEEGTPVTLTGAAGANTKPVTWTGCDSVNGENKCLVTMSAAKEVTATFALEQHLLSVSKTGSGTGKVTSSPPGIDCGATCSASFDHGTVVTLSASPDAGSEFSGWSGACTGTGTCEVTMSAAKSVTAAFDPEVVTTEFPLTVALEGTGSGTVTSDKGTIGCNPFCSDEYAEGTVVVLTATPAPGSVFISWKYCDKGGVNGRQCTMTVDKAKTVKATFTTTHALEVSKAPGSGLGKVQSSPGGILCLFNCSETTASFKEGAEVTLKQTPAKHFHFVEWLGDCTGSGACELTMGEDHEVQAKFAEDAKHLLTLTKSGGGQGTVKSSLAGINCGAVCSEQASAYFQGEVVELTATPGKGSVLGGWSGCDSEPEGRCLVAISEAKGVTAEFK